MAAGRQKKKSFILKLKEAWVIFNVKINVEIQNISKKFFSKWLTKSFSPI